MSLSIDDKLDFITSPDNLIPILKSELHRAVDSNCGVHGNPEQIGPNYTSALVCMITCEVMGRLFSNPELDDDDASIEFIQKIGLNCNDDRYKKIGRALVVLFRHGIAHSYIPKMPSPIAASIQTYTTDNGTTCIDLLASAEGLSKLNNYRPDHLSTIELRNRKYFIICPQVFYVDILKTIEVIEAAILQRDPQVIANFDRGFDKWWGRVTSGISNLDNSSKEYLGLL